MIRRAASDLVCELGRQFPAVLILGPRQCGKTTLARTVIKGTYFDLEKPSDQQVFLGDAEMALRRTDEPVILDEAQTLPALFPVLRALIDEKRQKRGRFYLLGSVNPTLVRHISESLAGRVGVVELTPFLYAETASLRMGLEEYWLRGGYPDACRTRNLEKWGRWQESYVRTFIERDVARHGIRISPVEFRRFLGMLAHLHGGALNASDLGRSLGITYHTVNAYLDLLEGHYLIRRLPPYFANIGKRLVKAPKIYVRDSGLLHHVLGIGSGRQLLESPRRGASWEGCAIEQIITCERLRRPGSQFFFHGTHASGEIDLVVDRGTERLGFEFKCAQSCVPSDWRHLRTGLKDGIITRGWVVYLGERSHPLEKGIGAISAHRLLRAGVRLDESLTSA